MPPGFAKNGFASKLSIIVLILLSDAEKSFRLLSVNGQEETGNWDDFDAAAVAEAAADQQQHLVKRSPYYLNYLQNWRVPSQYRQLDPGLPLGKKNEQITRRFSFGLGKRSPALVWLAPPEIITSSDLDDMTPMEGSENSSDMVEQLIRNMEQEMATTNKRAKSYSFGLGKRSRENKYNFGIGKRDVSYALAELADTSEDHARAKRSTGDDGVKRAKSYSFGLGKRWVDGLAPINENDDDGIDELMTSDKRGPNRPGAYAFGLGKRRNGSPYSFGLGKRQNSKMYSFGIGKRSYNEDDDNMFEDDDNDNYEEQIKRNNKMYSFGLGKRGSKVYSFGLGKRSRFDSEDDDEFEDEKRAGNRQYQFGLGKRSRTYSFGIGKRTTENGDDDEELVKRGKSYSFGIGKRENDDEKRSRQYAFGIGKREDDGDEQKRSRQYGFGIGKRAEESDEKRSKSYSFGLGKKRTEGATEEHQQEHQQEHQVAGEGVRQENAAAASTNEATPHQ